MKVLAFVLVSETSAYLFNKEVERMINNGYQPKGKVVVKRSGPGSIWYTQAMVKL